MVDIARIGSVEGTRAHGQGIVERYVDGSAKVVTQVATVIDVAGARLNLTAHSCRRRVERHILKQPAQGASAVQRPLRSTQYLNTLQIVRVEVSYFLTACYSRRRTIGHVVDGNADAGIGESTCSDASNRQLRHAITAGRHGQARDLSEVVLKSHLIRVDK